MLPDELGFKLLEKLKAEEPSKDIPIAMLTAWDSREDVAKGSELKAIGYLVKHSPSPRICWTRSRVGSDSIPLCSNF
jgi:DNA-binding response OmpR family regulator